MADETPTRTPAGRGPAITVDPVRRRRVLGALGGNHVRFCYQCGACVGDCPSARFHPGFNPREIMLLALLGALDRLIAPDGIIWRCSNCYTCYERCPQDVRPVDVILALKSLACEDGTAPAEVVEVAESIRRTGRSAPVLASLAAKRAQLGLPPLPPVDVAEIAVLLAPEKAADAPTHPPREEGA
jgi:heterodisulfide reductase subunit C